MIALRFGESPLRTAGAIALMGCLAVLSLLIGASDMNVRALPWDAEAVNLLVVSRLPRTLAALLAGSGLAIAGLVMQNLARNRYVEPATAGTAQSAALGILIVTLAWPEAGIATKTAVASVAALTGTSLFLVMVRRLPPTQPYLVALFGLVYGGVVGACVTFLAWRTDLLQLVGIWMNGEFSGVLRGRYELLWLSVAMLGIAWWAADRLTILSLGREASVGLGLDYPRMVQLSLVIVSVISALSVVVVGMIPFVGLVVPALVSRYLGDNLRMTLPWVAWSGACLVLACDIVGRVVRHPYEIPVGTVVGVVGAMIFLALLFARGRDG